MNMYPHICIVLHFNEDTLLELETSCINSLDEIAQAQDNPGQVSFRFNKDCLAFMK